MEVKNFILEPLGFNLMRLAYEFDYDKVDIIFSVLSTQFVSRERHLYGGPDELHHMDGIKVNFGSNSTFIPNYTVEAFAQLIKAEALKYEDKRTNTEL